MRLSAFFTVLALAFFGLASSASAAAVFVYSLTSDGSHNDGTNPALSGSITVMGNAGDAFPLLDSAAVENINFELDGFMNWSNGDATVVSDDAVFNGDLGAATLTPSSGDWQLVQNSAPNFLNLYSSFDNANLGELWSWTNGPGTYDLGYSWSLTLQSETDLAPEPASAYLMLAGLAAVPAWLRRRSCRSNR